MSLVARPASPDDAERIAQIYNEGIEDRVGTFETRPRTAADVRAWFDGDNPNQPPPTVWPAISQAGRRCGRKV